MAFPTSYSPTTNGDRAYRDPLLSGHGKPGAGLGEWGGGLGFVIPVIGVDTNDIRDLVGAGGAIAQIFGGGSPDANKRIWSQIPAEIIGVTGGHGSWTDTRTGEHLTDADTDIRKGAVMASAVSMYNDHRNWWFDQTTGQHDVSGGTAGQRWNALFGPSTSFAAAYGQFPTAFQIFGDDPSQDPHIPAVGGTASAVPSIGLHPITTTPYNAHGPSYGTGGTAHTPTLANASLLGGLNPTALLVVGGGLLVGLLLMNRGRR